jgi:hypothetical protein
MFVHQDVCFQSHTWLDDTERTIETLPNPGVIGVAGVKDDQGVISNIEHCIPPKPAGHISIDKPVKVQTLDECLLIIPRSVFNELQFDEKVCDDWHLYAVDYSLSCNERRRAVYVIPEHLYHMTYNTNSEFEKSTFNLFSPGSLPAGYYTTLKKLLKKHRKYYPTVFTTCGKWETHRPIALQRLSYIIMAELIYYKQKFLGKPVNSRDN